MSQLNPTQLFISLASVNLDQLTEFYRQLLGIQPSQIIPGKYSEFQLVGVRLALFTPKPDHASEFAKPDQSAFSLCINVENLENAIAHLQNIHYPHPLAINHASHGIEVYIYDPDGNRIILYQPFDNREEETGKREQNI